MANYQVANRDGYTNSHPNYTLTNLPVVVTHGDMPVPITSNSTLALTAQDAVATNQPGTVGAFINYANAPIPGQTVTMNVPVVAEKLINGIRMPMDVVAQVGNSNFEYRTMLNGVGAGNSGATNEYNGGTNLTSAAVETLYGGYIGEFRGLSPSPLQATLSTVPESAGLLAVLAFSLFANKARILTRRIRGI